jgi:hypothetical protein
VIDFALELAAALVAGLAASGHCAAMCGGIATAGGAALRRGARLPVGQALAFNGARIASYATVGATLALAVGAAGARLPVLAVAHAARLLAALALAALALRLVSRRDLFGVERAGAALWRALAPVTARLARVPPTLRPLALGAVWGLMPCGLVYSVMLVAAARAEPLTAAATMLAYGLGTLPALLGLTLAAAPLGGLLARTGARRTAAALILCAAAWTALGTVWHPMGHHHAAALLCTPADAAG